METRQSSVRHFAAIAPDDSDDRRSSVKRCGLILPFFISSLPDACDASNPFQICFAESATTSTDVLLLKAYLVTRNPAVVLA